MATIILINKPYNMLSQFTDDRGRPTLAELFAPEADIKGFYPAGRLDRDSEGLLLLTNDGALQHRITNPSHKLAKKYWVQVEGKAENAQLEALRQGLELNDGRTRPAKTKVIPAPAVWPRKPPIRERKNQATSWLEIEITEGRNRQVRRMTAAIGLPTLRLIRVAIGHWSLDKLAPGAHRFDEIHLPANRKKR